MRTKLLFLGLAGMTGLALHAQTICHSLATAGGSYTAPNNSATKTGYQLIFSDEFNDTPTSAVPNSNRWMTTNFFHGCLASELQCYVNDDDYPTATHKTYTRGTTGSSGTLIINAWNQQPPSPMWDNQPGDVTDGCGQYANSYSYTSGWFQSVASFKHGYFEIRCKCPSGNGYWPAFWTTSNDPGSDPNTSHEIDIFENFGDNSYFRHAMGTNFHWVRPPSCSSSDAIPSAYTACACTINDGGPLNGWWDGGFQRDVTMSTAGSQLDITQDFHTYGLEWSTGTIDYYLDNVLVRRVCNNCHVPDDIETLITNMAMANYGYSHGNPSTNTFPGKFEIDYIRVYKKIDLTAFGSDASAGGWNAEYPRMMADVDGDGDDDIVGFGYGGVSVSLTSIDAATGRPVYSTPSTWVSAFGYSAAAGAWRVSTDIRTMADVNGDGKADVVGFGSTGVTVALSTGSAFGTPSLWVNNYGSGAGAGGWSTSLHQRYMADVNNDGKADVVGFGGAGVYVSTSNGTSAFSSPSVWITNYGNDAGAGGWSNVNVRMVGDVNHDGKADVVGCGGSQVFVSYSTGSAFASPSAQSNISNKFCVGNSPTWTVTSHPRMLADVNADNYLDLVGFGDDGVYVSLGSANATQTLTFGTPSKWSSNFGTNEGWNLTDHVRVMADLTGDGRADIVGFGGAGVFTGYSYHDATGDGFRWSHLWINWYGHDGVGTNGSTAGAFGSLQPRMVARLNHENNGKFYDLIGFGAQGVFSTTTRNCPDCSFATNSYRLANPDYTPEDETATVSTESLTEAKLFPNPTTGNFTIQLPDDSESKIAVYDATGKLVTEKTVTTKEYALDLSGNSAGLYIVHIERQGKTQYAKLMLQ